jgi:SSS family solute:Na+ symporter
MLGGLIIVPIVSLLTQKRKPDGVDKLFECYKVTHTVSAKSSLKED